MNFLQDFLRFHRHESGISEVLCFAVIILLCFAFVSHLSRVTTLVHAKVKSPYRRKEYLVHRRPYIVTAFLSIIFPQLLAPMIRKRPDLIPWPLCIIAVVLYFIGIFCLLQLEAGLTLLFDAVASFPVTALVSSVTSNQFVICATFFICGVLIPAACLFYWVEYQNPLAVKYLGVGTLLDFEEIGSYGGQGELSEYSEQGKADNWEKS